MVSCQGRPQDSSWRGQPVNTHQGGPGKPSRDKGWEEEWKGRLPGAQRARTSVCVCAGCCPIQGEWATGSPGGPARPHLASLTVVMHGCPHKAAVGLGQGLVGRVLYSEGLEGPGVPGEQRACVPPQELPGCWHHICIEDT